MMEKKNWKYVRQEGKKHISREHYRTIASRS